MKIYSNSWLKHLISVPLVALLLAACGGGSGGSDLPVIADNSTLVNGLASKGPLNGSNVCAYSIVASSKGAALGTCVTTTANGNYSLNIGTYTGPALLEASGGSYVDEATGLTVALASPLRAMLESVSSGINNAAITPLTELAFQSANSVAEGLTSARMRTSISAVQASFGVSDIVKTMPVDALNVPSGATAEQKRYTLALATISQFQNSQGGRASLARVLQEIQDCLASPTTVCGAGDAMVGNLLNSAMSTFQGAHMEFRDATLVLTGFGSTVASNCKAPQSYAICRAPQTGGVCMPCPVPAILQNGVCRTTVNNQIGFWLSSLGSACAELPGQ